MDTKKILVILGAAFAMVMIFSGKAKAVTPKNVLITDYDSVWDYKCESGVWYTRKKAASSTGVWLNMQTTLKQENYNLAIARLTAYLTSKIN